jgi:hypothetical protein
VGGGDRLLAAREGGAAVGRQQFLRDRMGLDG